MVVDNDSEELALVLFDLDKMGSRSWRQHTSSLDTCNNDDDDNVNWL